MKELVDLFNVFKKFFYNKTTLYGFVLLFIIFILSYLSGSLTDFQELDSEFVDPKYSKYISNEDLKDVKDTFNKYCKTLIDTHEDNINSYNNIISKLMSLLKVFLLYLISAGLFTYIFVPYLKESKFCSLNKVYKYGFKYVFILGFCINPLFKILMIPLIFITGGGILKLQNLIKNVIDFSSLDLMNIKLFEFPCKNTIAEEDDDDDESNDTLKTPKIYKRCNTTMNELTQSYSKYNQYIYYIIIVLMPGFLLEKNKTAADILKFGYTGRFSKFVRNFVYLTLTLLFFIYMFMNIYLVRKLSKNNCYILKDLKIKDTLVIEEENEEIVHIINGTIVKNMIKKHAININNMVIILITIIIYSFNTDIFDGVVKFFKSHNKTISKLGARLTDCQKQ